MQYPVILLSFNAGTDMYADGRNYINDELHEYETLNPENSVMKELYTACYKGIRAAYAIKHYAADAVIDENLRSRRVDEARVLAANYYYILVNTFWGVPLMKDYVADVQTGYPKSSVVDVYTYIIEELENVIAAGAMEKSTALDGGGRISIESARALLFPMEKVFEAYVAKNLKKRLNQAGWDVSIQDKGYYLFDTLNGEKYQKFALRPDLVITRPDESIIILDTKWKSLINNKKANYGISQADMYQMYAYAKKYQASEVWLLYPMNEEMRNTEPILFDSGDGVRVSVFLVDVAQIEESLEKLFLAFASK